MADKTENRRINIYINQADAEKQLTRLQERATKLDGELQKLTPHTKEWNDKMKDIGANNAKIEQLTAQLEGRLGPTMKQLASNVRKLRDELAHIPKGTQEWIDKNAELQKVKTEYDAIRNKVNGIGGAFQAVINEVKKFGLIAIGALGLQQLFAQISNLIQRNSKLSDSMADVQKTTGLTAAEVRELNRELGKIDTRSSRIELLELARVAGKLGIEGKKEVEGFVRAADQLSVALSEDLGGNAEEAIRQVGKLVEIFKIREQFGIEQGMLKVGSAINALGAASTANEQYLVDFTARLGGSATTANISAQDILGYGATLDILGLKVEMSGTALSNFFIDFIKNTDKFEKAAGMANGSLQDLIGREGTNSGFIAFLEQLKKANPEQQQFLKKLEELGIDGARGAAVFLSLSNNVKLLKDQQKLSNEEFRKGTSLTQEFAVKNENFAAVWDKLMKKVAGFFISSTAVEGLDKLARGFNNLLEPTPKLSQEFLTMRSRLEGLKNETVPLLDQYDKLKVEAENNREKQEELKIIFEKLKEVLPGATLEYNKYGEAIGVNTKLSREYITQLERINEIKTEEEFEKQKDALIDLESQFHNLLKQQNLFRNGTKVSPSFKPTREDIEAGKVFFTSQFKNIDEVNTKLEDTRSRIFTIFSNIENLGRSVPEKLANLTNFTTQEKLAEQEKKRAEEAAKALAELKKKSIAELEALGTAEALAEIERRRATHKELTEEQKKFFENTQKLREELRDKKIALIRDEETREITALDLKLTRDKERITKEVADESVKAELIKEIEENFRKDLAGIQNKYKEKANDEGFKKDLFDLDILHKHELLKLEQRRAQGLITEKQYNDAVKKETSDHLDAKRDLHVLYGKDITDIDYQIAKSQIDNQKVITRSLEDEIRQRIDFMMKFGNEDQQAEARKQKREQERNDEIKKLESWYTEQYELNVGNQVAQEEITTEFLERLHILNLFYKDQEADEFKSLIDKKIHELERFANYAFEVFSLIGKISSVTAERELQGEKKKNDQKKKELKTLLDNKVITQEEYNSRVAKLDEDYDKKQRAVKREAARKERDWAIIQSIMHTAVAATEALPNLFLAAAITALGAAKTTLILAQPLPELKQGGKIEKKKAGDTFVAKGPTHENKGIIMVDGNTMEPIAEIENAETVSVASAASTNVNQDIVDWMIANPGKKYIPDYVSAQPAQIRQEPLKVMREGGYIFEEYKQRALVNRVGGPGDPEEPKQRALVNREAADPVVSGLMDMIEKQSVLIEKQNEVMSELNAELKKGIRSITDLRDLEEDQAYYNKIKQDSKLSA